MIVERARPIRAESDGVVASLAVSVGQQVDAKDLLLVLDLP